MLITVLGPLALTRRTACHRCRPCRHSKPTNSIGNGCRTARRSAWVQYGALDMAPTVIYVGMGLMMHLVAERMEQAAAPLMRGWADRWNAYRTEAERTGADYNAGVMRLDGKDNLNSGKRRPDQR
jgi:hypothetical protein